MCCIHIKKIFTFQHRDATLQRIVYVNVNAYCFVCACIGKKIVKISINVWNVFVKTTTTLTRWVRLLCAPVPAAKHIQ